jgi:CxxC motif-containing protein (DUF1111 family)
MVLRAADLDAPQLGCLLAALLGERDLMRGAGPSSSSSGGGGGRSQRTADLAVRIRVLLGKGAWVAAAADILQQLSYVESLLI